MERNNSLCCLTVKEGISKKDFLTSFSIPHDTLKIIPTPLQVCAFAQEDLSCLEHNYFLYILTYTPEKCCVIRKDHTF